MKNFFKEIFEYQHYYNQQLLKIFLGNKERISSRTPELFSHLVNAHQIWNARIIGGEAVGVHAIHSFEECEKMDRENYLNTLQILEYLDLDQEISYKNSKGDDFENKVRDILFHISNHTTHHRGQLISDLRQQGIEPPVTDYIFYKR